MSDDEELELPIFGQPRARRTDPETSHIAAGNAAAGAANGRRLVLEWLAKGPATDFELADATGWQQTSIGKRRGECRDAGLVTVATTAFGKPLMRPAPSGSSARVWRLTESGKNLLRRVAESD